MGPYTKGEKSKELLIRCAAELFLQKGYNATGINDILSSAGLTKGSFYFYFTSKKEIAAGVADYYNRSKIEELLEAAKGRTWEELIDKVVGGAIDKANAQTAFGCPLTVLSMELAYQEPEISEMYFASLRKIAAIFTDVLKKSGVPEQQAPHVADQALAMYEGYLLFYRISKNVEQLEMLRRDLKMIVKRV